MTPPQAYPGDPDVDGGTAAALGLSAREYRVILRRLGRTPTYAELGMFSVMWSEHCSYKHSRRILRAYPTGGRRVLQGPGENAGGVLVARNLAVLLKIESHNHPSYVEPYQGAATGVGGILRDIFTMGARPVALMDSLRFGPPRDARGRRLVAGVVAGIGGYGNCIGVPTVGGELEFDEGYARNCLVNALAVGTVEPARLVRSAAKGPGNLVVYMGAATGRDGIHGASLMASREFGGARDRAGDGGGISAVQVADPFLGKLLMETSIALCRRGLLVGMQDMGAAGLTCSTCETAAKGGTGMDVDLDRVPLRAAGMTPYEILLSESQERMLLIVEPRKLGAVRAVARGFGVPLAVVGRVRRGDRVRLWRGGALVADVPAHALTDEVPLHPLPRRAPLPQPPQPRRALPRRPDPERELLGFLADPSFGTKRPAWRQYDHMVRTDAVLLPGSDAAVLRLKGTGGMVAVAVDGPSRLVAADPYRGGELAIAEAARNVACAGARPVAFTNGLNFGNPDRPGVLWQFALTVRGIARGARALGTPVVSGNVSFFNAHGGRDIPPTPMVGMLGVLRAAAPVVQWFRRPGDVIVLLGPPAGTLSASAWQRRATGGTAGRPAPVRWRTERALQAVLARAAEAGWLSSAHDCSDGGLLAALAECCASGEDAGIRALGCAVTLTPGGRSAAEALFGEAPSRVIASLDEKNLAAFGRAARGLPWRIIGRVEAARCTVRLGGRRVVDLAAADIARARAEGGRRAIG